MPAGSQHSRMLAEAFLNCDWSLEALHAHGRLVLQVKRPRQWFSRFIEAIFSQFESTPSRRALIKYIDGISHFFEEHLAKLPSPTLLQLPPPAMRPAKGCPSGIAVPALTTTGAVADWFGITCRELDWFTDHFRPAQGPDSPLRHYRYNWLAKRSGKLRLLEIPKPRLKEMQRQILHHILDQIPPHNAAHAFRSGRSAVTYVAPHCGQDIVLHLDLQDFFPSIPTGKIYALWRMVGYPDRVARSLTALCTHRTRDTAFQNIPDTAFSISSREIYRRRHLPQGAPTSPALANLCAWRLDLRLAALAKTFSATYTRYADDLLFSGGTDLRRGTQRFCLLVSDITRDEGFSIHSLKTQVRLQSQSQQVAGIVLNSHPNPVRQDFDDFKALLYNCVRFGPASQNRTRHHNFNAHLRGRLAYLKAINPQRGAKLQILFDQIQWDASVNNLG